MDNSLDKLADLLGNLLEKYSDKIDLSSLPDPPSPLPTQKDPPNPVN